MSRPLHVTRGVLSTRFGHVTDSVIEAGVGSAAANEHIAGIRAGLYECSDGWLKFLMLAERQGFRGEVCRSFIVPLLKKAAR